MKTVSPFLEIAPGQKTVEVAFDGETYALAEGANLAAALLGAGVRHFRATPVSGAPRAPFCMMGACFDCLVEIDGFTVQACMTTVKPGLKVVRLHGQEEPDDA